MNTSKRTKYILLLIPLLVGWSFERMLIDNPFGINFPIFIILLLIGGFGAAQIRGVKPARGSLFLILPILTFSFFTVFRTEPFTHFFDVLLTFISLVLLVVTFRGGRWMWYSVSDLIEKVLDYAISVITWPIKALSRSENVAAVEQPAADKKVWSSVLRGIVIAVPIILVLTALLSSADAVFNRDLQAIFSFLKWENFSEFTFRTVFVLLLSLFISVTYVFAHESSDDTKLRGLESPGIPSIVGQIETLVVLGLINLLFLLFLLVQFRYLFGGAANINFDGFTYAEYARKGFGELSFVAAISLFLLQAAHSLTRDEDNKFRVFQTGLSVFMVAQLMVILFSAYQRLTLYEAAYGFSRLRTYTHVFLFWIALVLITVAVLEIKRKSRFFPFVVLCAAFGFGLTINILNVDASIVKWNIDRLDESVDFDYGYIGQLSADAAPALVAKYEAEGSGSDPVSDVLTAAVICYKGNLWLPDSESWLGTNFAREKAAGLLENLGTEVSEDMITRDASGLRNVEISGLHYYCDLPNSD